MSTQPPAPPTLPLGPVLEGALLRFDQALADLVRACELLGCETGALGLELREAGHDELADRAVLTSSELGVAATAIASTRRRYALR